MTILLAIALVAFCTLLWSSFAIARHLRRGSQVLTGLGSSSGNDLARSRARR